MVLDDSDWLELLEAIDDKTCLPFIGPEANYPWITGDKDLAKRWAIENKYPLDDSFQLSRVSQFMAIKNTISSTKKKLIRELKNTPIPAFDLEEHRNTTYSVLSDFNLPIYITTNYDHLMESALKSKGKEPLSEFSVWNENLKNYMNLESEPSTFNNKFEPSVSNPLIYHLYGDIEYFDSMVLIEREYFDFITYMVLEQDDVIPTIIKNTFSKAIFLFIGYRLEDTNFLTLFQFINLIKKIQQQKSLAAQFTSVMDPSKRNLIEDYLNKYCDDMFKIRIYLGDSRSFCEELRYRYNKYKGG